MHGRHFAGKIGQRPRRPVNRDRTVRRRGDQRDFGIAGHGKPLPVAGGIDRRDWTAFGPGGDLGNDQC